METLREFVIMKTVKKGNECIQGKEYTIDNFIEIFRVKGIAAFLSVLFFITALLLPATAYMQHTGKTVRVGWHEAPYFITDKFGRRSGYSYEYQYKLAAYTGWNYEYVRGSWSQLLQMLKDGEIDLLSDVSFMQERTKDMLYASLPMGTEAY